MSNEEQNFFNLIESWDDTNIDIALEMMKGNKALKEAAQNKYQKLLITLKRKTLKSIKGMPKKWDKASKNTKIKLLDHLPTLKGSEMERSMNNFMESLQALEYYQDKTLHHLPSFLPKLKGLKYLYAKYGVLNSIPAALFELPKLSRINLIGNAIETLPTLTQTTRVNSLVLAKNNLQECSLQLQEYWPDLTELFLHCNQLSTLDLGGKEQVNLQRLVLNDNKLSSLPKNIDLFPNLEELHLSNNPLETLPSCIEQCTKLVYLSVVNLSLIHI